MTTTEAPTFFPDRDQSWRDLPFDFTDQKLSLRRVGFQLNFTIVVDTLTGQAILLYEPDDTLVGEELEDGLRLTGTHLARTTRTQFDTILPSVVLPLLQGVSGTAVLARPLGQIFELDALKHRPCQRCKRELVTDPDPDVIYCGRRGCGR